MDLEVLVSGMLCGASARVLVQPGLQQGQVFVHPSDVQLDGLVRLLDAPQL